MKLIHRTLKRSFIILIVAVQTFGFSAASLSRIAVAEETTAPTEAAVSSAPTCPAVNGTNAPTGAGSHTFTFNPAPVCLWENAYYSWDPVTKVYTPKYDTYVCDADDVCETINWQYVSSDGRYAEIRTVVSAPAAATSSALPSSGSTGDTGNGDEAESTGTSIVSGNGTGSDNTITNNTGTNADIGLFNNASVLSALNSTATSGDAAALFNTTVGDMSTGDATTIANILNMIQSSWNPTNGELSLFNASLYNNYFGDLLFDPYIALGNGTNSTNGITNDTNNNLTLNVEENASIQNDINLNATSGDANASGNTTVGDVSTGDAAAIANVINMINSLITSGQSFLGSINLYGDLNGDILLPQSLLEILLGNGTGSSNTINSNTTTNTDANIATNSSITNNTDLTAGSGNATADANTTVGNISTGDAETKVNEMNLIGQNVQGTKGLLVFVNVLGSWIGMLFNSPVTSSIAAGNGTNSTNNISNDTTTNADINVERNLGIVNNLNLNAASGNATANANTTVGNVSTGNATSSVNLLNMIDSTMNFTDWFGVLFINVFGNWQGSFGVNTAAGGIPPVANGGGSSATPKTGGGQNQQTSTSAGGGGSTGSAQNTFAFIPRISGSNSAATSGSDEGVVAAANTETSTPTNTGEGQTSSTSTESNSSAPAVKLTPSSKIWLNLSLGLVAVMLIFGERLVALVRQ